MGESGDTYLRPLEALKTNKHRYINKRGNPRPKNTSIDPRYKNRR